jgi:hypothetical protein
VAGRELGVAKLRDSGGLSTRRACSAAQQASCLMRIYKNACIKRKEPHVSRHQHTHSYHVSLKHLKNIMK